MRDNKHVRQYNVVHKFHFVRPQVIVKKSECENSIGSTNQLLTTQFTTVVLFYFDPFRYPCIKTLFE